MIPTPRRKVGFFIAPLQRCIYFAYFAMYLRQLCEEIYPDHKAQTSTIEQEEILAEDAHLKRRAMAEAVPTSWAITHASESRSPYNVVF